MRFATFRAVLIASTSILAAACAGEGTDPSALTSNLGTTGDITTASTPEAKTAKAEPARGELQKATDYWRGVYTKNPADVQAAYNYARNLKALGDKRQAHAVLQAAYELSPNNKAIASEFGRLALEFDQISLAQRLLEQADDPADPDWRVVSARGTVFAKQGLYPDAIPFYERAMEISPDQPSVLSNLALAYMMEGHPDKAEPLLRRASALPNADARVGQNLALLLELQGKQADQKKNGMSEWSVEVTDSPAPKADAVKPKPGRQAELASDRPRNIQSKPAVAATAPAPDQKLRSSLEARYGAGFSWNSDVAAAVPQQK